ncbi:YqaE/Pmp3 family membrane protein [Pseudidiomarina aestuarii]|uniref:YqaE/Pmp3 family membrane protein n=1 Tax=Pseudidiomarina aestuarii TaxID=624146 RepID=A0A7Z7ESL7_9GAMM|nr:YqaE/Pmp3 family membrane protein [Pseudidiomarina aestuarii]RUO39013.1 YqaE/Pmp3 family membrane protein [Pseudidiomarina aestuarii]
MRYLLAIFLPPLAILTTGRIFHAILSTVLCAVVITLTLVSVFGLAWLWLVCIMHAAFVIDGYHKRNKQVGGDA